MMTWHILGFNTPEVLQSFPLKEISSRDLKSKGKQWKRKCVKQQHSKSDHKTAKVSLQSMVHNDRAQLTLFYIDARNSRNFSNK